EAGLLGRGAPALGSTERARQRTAARADDGRPPAGGGHPVRKLGSWATRPRGSRRTTLHNTQSSRISIHYPFHPLAGAELDVVRASRYPEIPITVRGPDGVDLKIPRWMTEPAAERFAVTNVVVLAVEALRTVRAVLHTHEPVKPSEEVTHHPRSGALQPDQEDAHAPAALRVVPTTRRRPEGGGRA